MTGKGEFFPCDAEHFNEVYHSKVTEEQEERTAKALKEYRQRKELPESPKKAWIKYLNFITTESIKRGSSLESYEHSFNAGWLACKAQNKELLETARKKLKEVLAECERDMMPLDTTKGIKGKVIGIVDWNDFKDAIAAVFGGVERK